MWAEAPGGIEILAPLDDYVGRAIFYFGDLDPKIAWVCGRIVRPGDTVLDIGANIGSVSALLSSLVGPQGQVHSFEPNPRLAGNIAEMISRNCLTNVFLRQIGLGEVDDVLDLTIPDGNSGAGSFVRHSPSPDASVIRVPVRQLSDVVANSEIDKIDFIKIDVEGFEPQVLRGGRSAIEKHRPRAILFELNNSEVPLQEHPTIKTLKEMDYRFLSLPKRLLRMRAERWEATSCAKIRANDFVACPAGATYDDVAALLI